MELFITIAEENEEMNTAENQAVAQDETASVCAAQELLENGILVETNKGLICMSLKDALNQGVGGVTLSKEDFQNVATKLLSFQEVQNEVVTSDASSLQIVEMPHVKPTRTVPQPRRALVKNKDKTIFSDSDIAGPSTSKTVLESDSLQSVLVSDSGLSSDTSEVVSISNASSDSAPPKRRGGWPKGRKRKPDNKSEIRPPKAPATGYVIYLNEKRQNYKHLRFTEVTKLLGNEWSRLSIHEKRKYLDQAEIEKKRYREELKIYRQSEAYRLSLKRRRAKRILADCTEESDMDWTDEIDDDEDSQQLYCRPCNQWFHSLHNKKEHMYGKQHLTVIAGCSRDDWPASTSLDESSLDGLRDDLTQTKDRIPFVGNMDDAIVRFTSTVLRREREVSALKEMIVDIKERKQSLAKNLVMEKKREDVATRRKEEEFKLTTALEQRMWNLLRVPTTFGEYSPD